MMNFLWPLITRSSLFVIGFIVLAAVVRQVLKWRERRRSEHARVPRCACGYPLEGRTLARCPECGRVLGFESTAEELGLTENELKRIADARRRRATEEAAERAATEARMRGMVREGKSNNR